MQDVGAQKACNPVPKGIAELVNFQYIPDSRGALSIAEMGKEFMFAPRRLYWIHGGDAGMERGGHAHYTLRQLLIPMFGAFEIDVDDGTYQQTFVLDRPSQGLLLYPVVWRDIKQITPGGTLAVIASDGYDEADYIRDKREFDLYMAGSLWR